MRIDAYNQVAQMYQTTQAKTTTGKHEKDKSFSDALQLSQTGRNLQAAKMAVKEAPDVREDKVAQIKAQMASGTYNVTGEQLADKLVNSFFDGII